MNEYQFVICYKPWKDNVVAEFLSRNPIAAINIERVDLQALQEEDPLIKQLLEDMRPKSTLGRWKKLRERDWYARLESCSSSRTTENGPFLHLIT